ncbi:MAG TPA: VCBS repeat-containing protein [Thermoanaerobaculia bacterium]|jgi:hypothetical protein|nr:VCBS repeat-containing protein [Thermoanaerobaculia bacterium]
MKRWIAFHALLIMAASSALAASAESVVSRFFPPALTVDNLNKPVPIKSRHYTFVLGDLNHDGTQLICAVYWNERDGAVSVLSPVGDGSLIATVSPADMPGRSGKVQLLDFDNDGRPEIVVTMDQLRGPSAAWIYKWTGAALQLMGPTDPEGRDAYSSDLADPTFLDVDGSGSISVIDHSWGRGPCVQPCDEEQVFVQYRLFQLVNGNFKPSGDIDCFKQYLRGTGAPQAQTDSFSATDPAAPRQLVVVNGERDGSARASSARVVLNGQSVVGSSSFNQKVGVIRLPVALAANNTLTVTIDGKPGATVTVLLLPSK